MISVIVPVYNVYPYLKTCIGSICDQTYKDLEIILVNDGSTDGSGEICDTYERVDSRIKVLHQHNQGLSVARNNGVKIATGEWVVFVDSDDVVHPQMIELLKTTREKVNADIVICSRCLIDETEIPEYSRQNLLDISIYSGRECVKMINSNHSMDMVVAWNKLYKKEYLLKTPYPIGKMHEDEFVTYKILYSLERCAYIPCELYFYRQRKESIVHQVSDKRILDKISAYSERKDFFKKMDDKELYCIMLRKYQTFLAETYFYIKENNPQKYSLLEEIETQFTYSWKNEIKISNIEIKHKIKFYLFMLNKGLYKKVKKIYEGKKSVFF